MNNLISQSGTKRSGIAKSMEGPVLGILENFKGMRKVNILGIKQANKCMLMAAGFKLIKPLRS